MAIKIHYDNLSLEIEDTNQYSILSADTLQFKTGTDFNLIVKNNSIQYPNTYNTSSVTFSDDYNYIQTFNGAHLTATLPLVVATNVGIQFLITNTYAGNLSVSSTEGQLIYSTKSPSSVNSRTLATGHSHIFTAIRTTSTDTYGWSMV